MELKSAKITATDLLNAVRKILIFTRILDTTHRVNLPALGAVISLYRFTQASPSNAFDTAALAASLSIFIAYEALKTHVNNQTKESK